MSRRVHGLLVATLCLAFFLQCFCASRQKSPTSDEPLHIVAGASYVATGRIVANPQHPPLLKELAGLSMAAGGIRLRASELEKAPQLWANSASEMLVNAGVARLLFWARLPMLLLSPLLALAVYWLGRELAGPAAGLGALFLLAADPTMVAHSYLVTTDAGVTTFSLLFLLALMRYLQQPGAIRLAVAATALGIALCTKFSAIFLLPIAGVLLVASVIWPLPSYKGANPRRLVSVVYELAVMGVLSVAVMQICYLSLRGPQLYIHGLGLVNADHDPNYKCYLAGQFKHRFLSYFAAAWLLKEPLATIALALAGAVLALRRRSLSRLTKLFLAIPPIVFFVACTVWADDLGIRYEMPAMAFGFIAGGIALAALWSGPAILRVTAAAACAWVALAAVGIYPDHLSYFNEMACLTSHPDRIGLDGGSRCGPEWLADSNVDWGQGLPQLKEWLDQNAPGRTARILKFASVSPAAYGIPFEDADRYITAVPQRGLYVISAHLMAYLTVLPNLSWVHGEPEAIVGHAYYVFEF